MNGQLQADEPALSASGNAVGRRIVAGLVDFALITAVFLVFALTLGRTDTDSDGAGGSFSAELGPGASLLLLAAILTYYIAMESAVGATVGKLLLGLRVVSVDGGPASLGQVVVRTLIRIIDAAPFLYLVGIIVVAISKRDQRLGDMAAKTLVVRG